MLLRVSRFRRLTPDDAEAAALAEVVALAAEPLELDDETDDAEETTSPTP